MSIVDHLDPEGKEVQIGDKKYNQDSKIIFNIKAFISLSKLRLVSEIIFILVSIVSNIVLLL